MNYGDISPRTAGYVTKELLARAMPYLVLEKFGQAKPLPGNSTQSMVFRRYSALTISTTPLSEGVTPSGKTLQKTDVTVTIKQYGDFVGITDVIADTHEDPVMREAQDILAEQAAQTLERVRWSTLVAGSNVFFANGTVRNQVNTKLTTVLQRKVVKTLKRQNARQITSAVASTPAFNTVAVKPAYVAVGHTDLQADIEDMTGFRAVEYYGNGSAYETEIGAVGDVRYVTSTLCVPFANDGGTKGTMESTGGVNADVYPVLYIGRDAYGLVPLKGKSAIVPTVVNPKPVQGDDLGQRGSVGWKAYHACVILNDAWMCRAEVACTA